MKKSILFPGQGSQYVGMGLDFYKNFNEAKEVFDEVDNSLNFGLSKIIFEDMNGNINLTANTQPAIMATGVAIFRVLKSKKGFDINNFNYCAGHSLGEYTALVCSEALSLSDAAKILRARGEAMQSAVKPGDGAMAAILGSNISEIEDVLKKLNLYSVEISNDNCPGQIVISGKKNEIDKCCLEIRNIIKKKNIILPVSAPFHCKLMIPASDAIKDIILNTNLKQPKIPIITNVKAVETLDTSLIKNLLIEQIYKRVRWREIIERMFLNDVSEFTEIGPGRALSGMLKRFQKDVLINNYNSIEDLKF